jgi:hypothetical protein
LALYASEITKLRRIIAHAEKLIAQSPKPKRGRPALTNGARSKSKRGRRSGKQLAQFRKMLKAERKKGIPVAELARKHRVSTAYIYTLP